MSVLVVPIALLIGASLGALGGGGSILTVPALVYVLGQNAHGATTASLVIVGITALAGMVAHARRGNVRFASGTVFAALGVAASFAGSRLSAGVNASVLLLAFSGLMLVAAAAMARRHVSTAPPARSPAAAPASASVGPGSPGAPPPVPDAARGEPLAVPDAAPGEPLGDPGASPPASPAGSPPRWLAGQDPWRRRATVVAAALVVGLVTGFFGVGGGFVVVPALALALGFSMPEAVGTSLLVIAVNSAAALGARVGTPLHVDWPLVAVFTAIAMAGTLAGNRIAAARPHRLVPAFTVLLVAVAFYTAGRSLPHVM
ncbi:MAG TPA: TSUP family transporter [Acidimicrobiales bacterium]|nr:TSUP family transporter [Acidimicrobiales bacterium]